jgi:hypothetical protein
LSGAGNGIRTRDTELGKLVLYQLSYARLLFKFMQFSAECQADFSRPAFISLKGIVGKNKTSASDAFVEY